MNQKDCDSKGPGLSNSDETLIRTALRDPDSPKGRQAASELFKRYQKKVYSWCFRYVHNHEAALDLAQDALMSAYKALSSFQGSARFSSWLFAITRNRCLNAIKAVHLFRDEEADPDDLPDKGMEVDKVIQDEEEEQALLDLIKRELDPIQQEALFLRCFERLPVDEITRLLKIQSPSGARGVLQSARRKLRAALEDKETQK